MSHALAHMRSNAVAYLALFVALGGTSYAAVQLPRNSVGSAQIKTGAVASSEIKNGSVRSGDLAASTKASLMGQTGAAGAKGDKGDKGDTGPAGPVEVIKLEDVTLAPVVGGSGVQSGTSISLPAGKWLVQATMAPANTHSAAIYVTCELYSNAVPAGLVGTAGSVTIPAPGDAPSAGSARQGAVSLIGTVELSNAAFVSATCERVSGGGSISGKATITAARVSSVAAG